MAARAEPVHAGLVALVLRDPIFAGKIIGIAAAGGGRALAVATHTVKHLPNCAAARIFLTHQERFTLAIFASPNAVRALAAAAASLSLALPAKLRCAGPGVGTRAELRAAGFTDCVSPEGVGSMAELLGAGLLGNLAGARIALVQRVGASSRTCGKLSRLAKRVTVVACYRRAESDCENWQNQASDAVRRANCLIAYDAPALRVLLAREEKNAGRLRGMPLAVPHSQIAVKARALGFESIIVRDSPNAMLDELSKKMKSAD